MPISEEGWKPTIPAKERIVAIDMRKVDQEFTSLLGGKRVQKYHLRPETYGTLDELNSFLGMARAATRDKVVKQILFTIQNHFFVIGSDLALSGKDRSLLKVKISQKEIDWLNQLYNNFRNSLKLSHRFVIYGETQVSSIIDVARAISRREERLLAKMKLKRMLDNLKILEYISRLSDVLYLLARYEEKRAKVKFKHPTYKPMPANFRRK